ncbi:MAG TPA: hypothetical protein VF635_17550, partial [Propionibacteriaceae bacterium]
MGDDGVVDLTSVADELYGGSPDDFIERRKQRVADARAARDRPLAKAISQLRRPTRSAWMVNVLAREAPDAVAQLLDLGVALAEAQQRGAGPDLRRLSQDRHAMLDALTRQAVRLAQSQGHAAAEASRLEVTQTLQAALADGAVADLVRTGQVTQPVTYAGFGPMELGAFEPRVEEVAQPEAQEAAQPEAEAVESEAEEERPEAEEVERPEAEEVARPEAEEVARPRLEGADPLESIRGGLDELVQAATAALRTAEHEAAEADREAAETTEHADDLADQVEVLRTRLQQAEDDERAARSAARVARRRAQQHQQSLSDATR